MYTPELLQTNNGLKLIFGFRLA